MLEKGCRISHVASGQNGRTDSVDRLAIARLRHTLPAARCGPVMDVHHHNGGLPLRAERNDELACDRPGLDSYVNLE